MTIDNKNSEKTAAHDTSVSKQRRTLIKASAATPLAATLFSGSALATSSLACMGGDFSNKKFVENGNSINGDTAVRIAVDYYKRVTKPPGPGNNFPHDLYDIEGTLYHNSGSSHSRSIITDKILADHYDKTTAYVLVLYSFDNGCTTELGPWPKVQLATDGGNGTPITGSCLTSIAVSDSCNII